MCTALTLTAGESFFFGRNLDLDQDFGQEIVVTPRDFHFQFTDGKKEQFSAALIGMAVVMADRPMYFEATSEYGLSMAGLNFPGNAVFHPEHPEKINVAPFELIPWVLRSFKTVAELKTVVPQLNISNTQLTPQITNAPLHWIVADAEQAIVLESQADGLHVYDNPAGALTNNPPFSFHLENLRLYQNCTPNWPNNQFSDRLDLTPGGVGYGSSGLPGGTSPAARLVNTVFLREATEGHLDTWGLPSSPSSEEVPASSTSPVKAADPALSEVSAVAQFLHILQAVGMVKGSTRNSQGLVEYTIYSSCCNTTTGTYFYTTYANQQLNAVRLSQQPLDSDQLICYPMLREPIVNYQD